MKFAMPPRDNGAQLRVCSRKRCSRFAGERRGRIEIDSSSVERIIRPMYGFRLAARRSAVVRWSSANGVMCLCFHAAESEKQTLLVAESGLDFPITCKLAPSCQDTLTQLKQNSGLARIRLKQT